MRFVKIARIVSCFSLALCVMLWMSACANTAKDSEGEGSSKAVAGEDEAARREKERLAKLAVMEKIGTGINLGNDLDVVGRDYLYLLQTVTDFETFWKNPPAAAPWFVAVREAGFQTVRIPVSWGNIWTRTDISMRILCCA